MVGQGTADPNRMVSPARTRLSTVTRGAKVAVLGVPLRGPFRIPVAVAVIDHRYRALVDTGTGGQAYFLVVGPLNANSFVGFPENTQGVTGDERMDIHGAKQRAEPGDR